VNAAEAARAIHAAQLVAMRRTAAGLRAGLEVKLLHDFRVAVRRTRSALTQIRGVFPPREVEHFKSEFRWLGAETSPLRDLDVFLATLDSHGEKFDSLRSILIEERRVERARVAKMLDSPRYETLIDAWSAFLDQPFADAPPPPSASLPARAVAARSIRRAYRRMLRQGKTLGPEAPAQALHDLRIRMKKLRYLLEFFRDFFPAQMLEGIVADLKRLQDHLGRFHDCVAQLARLERLDPQPAELRHAVERLRGDLTGTRATQRRRFTGRFSRFASASNRAAFRRLLREEGPPDPGPGNR